MSHRAGSSIVVGAIVFCATAFSQSGDPDRGRFEVRGFIGTAVDTSTLFGSTSKVGGGVEGAFDLNRHVAVTGNYTFNRNGRSEFCFVSACPPIPDEKIHEFLAGVRFSWPHRVTPYLLAAIGGIKLDNVDSNFQGHSSEFALGVGAGMNIRITHKSGIGLDLRGIKAVSSNIWWAQPSAGYYFRF